MTVEVLAGADRVYDHRWGSRRSVIRDDFSRLYRVRRGRAVVTHAGTNYDLRPGSLCLIPAGTAAKFGTAAELHLAWLHLRLEAAPGVDLWHRHPGVHSQPLGRAGPTLDRLLAGLGTAEPPSALRAMGGLLDLLAGFVADTWSASLPDSAALSPLLPALQALQREPQRPWSLAQLAGTVHLHPTYLANRFSALFGCGPMHFLHRLRLRRARHLLLTTTLAIKQVGVACGYEDALYFSRRFRTDVGVPPTRYRNLREWMEQGDG